MTPFLYLICSIIPAAGRGCKKLSQVSVSDRKFTRSMVGFFWINGKGSDTNDGYHRILYPARAAALPADHGEYGCADGDSGSGVFGGRVTAQWRKSWGWRADSVFGSSVCRTGRLAASVVGSGQRWGLFAVLGQRRSTGGCMGILRPAERRLVGWTQDQLAGAIAAAVAGIADRGSFGVGFSGVVGGYHTSSSVHTAGGTGGLQHQTVYGCV